MSHHLIYEEMKGTNSNTFVGVSLESSNEIISSQAQQSQPQWKMEALLVQVEDFLLPKPYNQTKSSYFKFMDENPDLPIQRLYDICYEVLLADHIRSLQIMYRDNTYPEVSRLNELLFATESILKKKPTYQESEINHLNDHSSIPSLSNEILVKKNLEGRTKIHALSKLCYGSDSIEALKSDLDLINAYALLGHWSVVNEQVLNLLSKYMYLQSKKSYVKELNEKSNDSILAATKMKCFYDSLRDHAVNNRGQVTMGFVKELTKAFKLLLKPHEIDNDGSNNSNNPNIKATDSYLDAAIGSDDETDEKDEEYIEIEGHNDGNDISKIIQSVKSYLRSFSTRNTKHSNSSSGSNYNSRNIQSKDNPSNILLSSSFSPSWGNMIDYIRYHDNTMKSWLIDVENGLLPQIKSLLLLSFHPCDSQQRGISNPRQLISQILHIPSIVKIISSHDNMLLTYLADLKINVSLLVQNNGNDSYKTQSNHTNQSTTNDVDNIEIIDITTDVNTLSTINQNNHVVSVVTYELPVTWEEVVSTYTLYNQEYSNLNQYNQLFKAQLLTLLGVCQIFHHENISEAEDTLRKALKEYEILNLQDSILSCELYNAIAQLMISKYKFIDKSMKSICEIKAMEWIESEEGSNQLKEALSTLRRSKSNQKSSILVNKLSNLSQLDGNIRIKNDLMKEKTREYMSIEITNNNKSMEAAYRYLIRSYEIMESYHGTNHIVIATSCIAIASIKNTIKDHIIAREWLSKALKILTKLESMEFMESIEMNESEDRLPMRVIAYVQIQLAHIMFRSGHENEGMLLLSNSSIYHMKKAYYELKRMNKTIPESQYISNPIRKSMSVYEDIQLAVVLTSRRIQIMSKDVTKQWEVIELSQSICTLNEIAFGLDSSQAGEQRKQVGIRYALVGDWMNAISNLRKASEIFEELYGEDCKHCLLLDKLLEDAAERRMESFLNLTNGKEFPKLSMKKNLIEVSEKSTEH